MNLEVPTTPNAEDIAKAESMMTEDEVQSSEARAQEAPQRVEEMEAQLVQLNTTLQEARRSVASASQGIESWDFTGPMVEAGQQVITVRQSIEELEAAIAKLKSEING